MTSVLDRLRRTLLPLLAGIVLAIAWARLGHASEPEADVPTVRRFALIVGANDGGPERVRLHYATRDADAMAAVMRDLGGVRSSDLLELRDPTPAELEAAFGDLTAKLRRAAAEGARTPAALLLLGALRRAGSAARRQRMEYRTLRSRVQAVPADVRIAILDSCASGAFTRVKGGTRGRRSSPGRPAKVEGHAFLTSSSADEAAQESDRVGGSFFTHFLATGLRGAADIDGDRFVTLIEAYEFAFDETLARTESTRGGAQHAAYDIQLAGSGDLVMTDLRKTSATLVLGPDVGGRVYVRIRRRAGWRPSSTSRPVRRGVDLALEAGRYEITVDDGRTLRRATVELDRKEHASVKTADFRVLPPRPGPARATIWSTSRSTSGSCPG